MLERTTNLSRSLERQNDIISKAKESIEKLESVISKAEEELVELKGQESQFNEELQQLNSRREQLIDERASLRSHVEQQESNRESIKSRLEGLVEQIRQKEATVGVLEDELNELGITIPTSEIQLPTVAEAEKRVQGLDRRLSQLGNVNMLAIDDYDRTVERIAALVADGKLCKDRHAMLVSLAENLEEERKTRILAVFSHVNTNFKRAYEMLQPGGEGQLLLENPKNPFEGGLEMACIPPGKSKRTRRSFLSGGEKSMAALAFIFAIQDYEPSPFYYFDEVDQNLDPFNAERIATLCRLRSRQAQFIMVTLRKVSLTLADHHIGITHAGDGCSRRIADFDRAAALELGEEFEAEKAAQEKAKVEKESMTGLPKPENMPRVPEPMGKPQSLGGLAERAGVSDDEGESAEFVEAEAVVEDESISSLKERTEEWTEDISEKEAAIPLVEEDSIEIEETNNPAIKVLDEELEE